MNKMAVAVVVSMLAFLSCLPEALRAQEGLDTGETISARGYSAIEAAIPELKRHTPDFADYVITVQREGTEVVVQFLNSEDAAPHRRHVGCLGPKPCLAVRLRASDLKVLRSSLQK